MLDGALIGIAALSLAIWLYLLGFRGGFWRADRVLDGPAGDLPTWPEVAVIVPARNEAAVIGTSLHSLIGQDYPGRWHVVLVDDHSEDRTAAIAHEAARSVGASARLHVVLAASLPSGWAGKVWAMSQGLEAVGRCFPDAAYIWLTDADICHDPQNLRRLVAKAEQGDIDLVSQMVVLVSEGFWSSLLIPAFVLFFQKLYPFSWVNRVDVRTAAAAGGSMLLRRTALRRIEGFSGIRGALIDDCALARAVKRQGREGGGRLWLGLTTAAESIRPYHGLAGVWRMVARSAFTQLRHSAFLLFLTELFMAATYLTPPLIVLSAPWHGDWTATALAALAWTAMTVSFAPVLRLYRRSLALAPLLPLAGTLYASMTLHSAVAHWRGRGGAWKGRLQSRAAG